MWAAIVVCFTVTTTRAVKWINCPGATLKGKVSDVIVVGCESTPVCELKKGQNASIEIDFTSDVASAEATSVVHGIIAGVPFPFSPPNPHVCKDSGVVCPLKKDEQYKYKTYIYVKSEYPSVAVKVKWEIQDVDGNDIVCIELPAKLSSVTGNRLLFQPRQPISKL